MQFQVPMWIGKRSGTIKGMYTVSGQALLANPPSAESGQRDAWEISGEGVDGPRCNNLLPRCACTTHINVTAVCGIEQGSAGTIGCHTLATMTSAAPVQAVAPILWPFAEPTLEPGEFDQEGTVHTKVVVVAV